MNFRFRLEAYLHSIYILREIRSEFQSQEEVTRTLDRAVDQIRIEVEKHQQDMSILTEIISKVLSETDNLLDDEQKKLLLRLIDLIKESEYTQTMRNDLGRRIESQIQIELLLNPTDAIMDSVKKMSEKLVEILDSNKKMQDFFVKLLQEKGQAIAFGGYKKIPSYQDSEEEVSVRNVLLENRKKDLIKIMYMHFRFVQFICRGLTKTHPDSAQKVALIADTHFKNSDYFKKRARKGMIQTRIKTQRMGLSVSGTDLCTASLPIDESVWVADAKAQAGDLNSPLVRRMIEMDTPYVSGPSNMTGLFLGQIIGFDIFDVRENKDQMKLYLAAVAAYIVSGGLHSLNEVLSPVAHCLSDYQLIPGYRASLTEDDKKNDEPPNYHAFYSEIERIDPQFSKVREKGWEKVEDFFANEYLPYEGSNLKFYNRSLENMKDQFLCAIQSYLESKTGRQANSSGFFHSKPLVWIQNFHRMLEEVETPFQAWAVSFALLSCCKEKTLKEMLSKKVASVFKCNAENAMKYLSEVLKDYIFTLMGVEAEFEIVFDKGCYEMVNRVYDKLEPSPESVIKPLPKAIIELAEQNSAETLFESQDYKELVLRMEEIEHLMQEGENLRPSR